MTGAPKESPANVYQRFSMACKIIGSQAWVKDMSNAQFKSIPIDAMRKGVREACVQAGLVHVGPCGLEYTKERIDRTTKWTGTCTFRYFNIDNPEQVIVFESLGEAMDNGDKGAGKLISNLIKTHYKAAFDIGEQGKDDVDHYSNEEIYEEADRIEERRRKASKTKDPFFSKKDDVVADRPIEDIKASLTKWADMEPAKSTIGAFVGAYGPMKGWTEGQLRQAYTRCVRGFQAQGGIPE